MNILIASASLVFAGSADTTISYICADHQVNGFLLAFSGFLNSTSDDINNFRCDNVEIIKSNMKARVDVALNRSKNDPMTEHHSVRSFESEPYSEKIIEWLFEAENVKIR